MAQNHLKALLLLSLVIYGCSVNNTNTPQTQNPIINNSVSATPSSTENIPSNISPSLSQPTETPAKELSTLEIKSIIDSGIVGANNKFAFDIFSELRKDDSTKNIFISPASLSFALSMVYNGADKETKEEMGKVLHIENLNLNSVNKANQLLLSKLKNPAPDVQLDIANSLWGNIDTDFIPEFINDNKQYYKAELNIIDFKDSSLAANKINKWVSDNTHGRIDNIIDPKNVSVDTLMYLVNAIYFKSNWTNKFDKDNTKDRDFYCLDKLIKVPMMEQFNQFKYLSPNSYNGNTFQGIELPYGKEGKVSMYVFLPSSDSNLDELYKTFNSSNFSFDEMLKSFYLERGMIRLPKFKIENNYSDLKNNFSNLGMKLAFDMDNANFFKIANPKPLENYFISYISHFANIDLDEEGTEAAAATVIAAESTTPSSEPMRTLEMIVDHPFFFIIRDNETGQFLFMGSITNPEQ